MSDPQCRTPIVPIRKSTPSTMRTTGPAKERCRVGGSMGGGATGLAILHLVGGMRWRYRLRRRRWNPSRVHRHRQGVHMPFGRRIALKQLNASDNEQDDGPCLMQSKVGNAAQ